MQSDNGALHFQATIDNAQLQADAERSKQILHGIGQNAQAEGNAIESTMKRISGAMAGFFAAGQLKNFAIKVAHVRGEFQQLEIAFNTMLGSKQKADALMQQLIKTAATTPFSMSEVAQSAKQLLAYGVEGDKVNGTLIRLGDIAAGLSIPLGDLAYLYGTTMVQGRMYTQDLNQFLNRGIPLTDELAKQFGVTKDKVRELVEQGKVGFPEVEKAIISLTSEGGRFYGLTEALSKSITGQLSNLEDEIEQMFNEIGKSSEGFISSSIRAVASVVEHWKTIGAVILTTTATYGIYKGALIAVNVVQAIHNRLLQEAALQKKLAAMQNIVLSDAEAMAAAKTTLLSTAMRSLKATIASNPLGLILTVVAAATTAFMIFKEKTDAVRKAQEGLNNIKEEAAKKASEEETKINLLVKAAKNEELTLRERKRAVQKLNSIIPNYNAQLDATTGRYRANAKALKDYISQLQRKYELEGAKELLKEKGRKKAEAKANYLKEVKKANEIAKEPVSNKPRVFFSASEVVGYNAAGGEVGLRKITVESMKAKALEKYKKAKKALDEETEAIMKAYGTDLQKDAIKGTIPNTNQTPTTVKSRKRGRKTKADEERKRIEEEIKERDKAIKEYKEKVEKQNEEAELEIRQKQIEIKQDGYEKQLQQIQLNYDKLRYENKKREKQMIEELKEDKFNKWMKKNPKASKKQQEDYKESLQVTKSNLTKQQQQQLKQYEDIADDYKIKANKEALKQILKDTEGYEQQRADVIEKYNQKIEQLYQHDDKGQRIKDEQGKDTFIKGASNTNVEELEYNRDNDLAAIDEQFAQRQEEFQAWCDEIANVSIEKLKEILDEAEEELKKLEKDKSKGAVSEKQLAVARAKATKARQALEKATAKAKLNPGKRSVKEWQDLYKTLNECAGSFKEIGNAVGGTVGKILSAAGQIATSTLSMINGIVTLVEMSSGAMTATAATASTAIQTVEKASVILTIISAALQVAMTIANMLSGDGGKEKEERIKYLQGKIDNLQWELEHRDIVRIQKERGEAYDLVIKKMKETQQEMTKDTKFAHKQKSLLGSFLESLCIYQWKSEKLAQRSAERIAKAYLEIGYAATKAFGKEKYEDTSEQLKNIANQQILLKKQIDAEKNTDSKGGSDFKKIDEWKKKMAELQAKASEIIDKAVEDIVGGTSDEIADKLGDAFISAFKEGEDAAKAWGDKVKDIVTDILKHMLVQEYLQKPMAGIFDKYKKKWYTDDGKFKGFDVVRESMTDFAHDLNIQKDNFNTIFNALPQEIKSFFTSEDKEKREASQGKGIATASQESVDELNGRITAIQGHTYNINENVKLMQQNTANLLVSVQNIERNTERLAAIEANIKGMNSTISDIALYGLKVK